MLNQRIKTLSLNYCELAVDSGRLLADTVPNTCIMYVGQQNQIIIINQFVFIVA